MSRMAWVVTMAAALAVATPAALDAQGRGRGRAQARETMRFAGMDRNGDGVITRAEWNGSDRSFLNHDWNRDGVLSGDEVRPGAPRAPRRSGEPAFDTADREYQFDDWTARGFTSLDHNRDNRITPDEWHFDREGFRRADHNRDNVLSRAEFLNEGRSDDDRDDRFVDLDADRDGRVSVNEWHGTPERFEVLDDNRDGYLSRREVMGADAPVDLFTSLDVNRDKAISRDEWHWSMSDFQRLDANRDGWLTRAELDGTGAQPQRNAGYKAGYDRGLLEGRQAGREDFQNNAGWDLEGQRELEQADSGYQNSLGALADYQIGYRDGFRRGYREGFAQR